MRCEFGKVARIVTQEIFGNRVGEQRGNEILRHLPIAAAQDFASRGNQRSFSAFFVGVGKVGGCHDVVPRRASSGIPLSPASLKCQMFRRQAFKGFGRQVLDPQFPRTREGADSLSRRISGAPTSPTVRYPSRVWGNLRPRIEDATSVRSTCAVPPAIVNIRASRKYRSSGLSRE